MTKNITVIDENEKILGSTYPKRALGLVKKGRARWINSDTIRLCAQSMEDKDMASNIYEVFDNQISKMQEQLSGEDAEAAMSVRMQILKTMEVFRAQEHEAEVLKMIKAQLDAMQESMNREEPTAETATAIARETTRQKMLELMSTLVKSSSKGDTVCTAAEA